MEENSSNPGRRREQRIQLKESVQIALLGPPGGAPISGTLVDISGSGVRILASRPLPCGTLVTVESPNRLMLGEVLRSDPEGDSFTIGIQVRNTSDNYSDLERLNRQIRSELTASPAASLIMKK